MYKAFVFITVEIAPASEKNQNNTIKSETKCIFQGEYSGHGFTHAFKHKATQHRAKGFQEALHHSFCTEKNRSSEEETQQMSHAFCFLFLSHQLRNYVVTLKIDIHIISEFQYQECTFEEIQALGFEIQKIKVGFGPFISLVKSVLY